MTTATLSNSTSTPTLPFDFDGFGTAMADEEVRNADRKVCKEYLGTWANNFGKAGDQKAVDFETFSKAAARLNSVTA